MPIKTLIKKTLIQARIHPNGQEPRLAKNTSDQHSSHGNNSIEGHIISEIEDGAVRLLSLVEH